MRDLRANDWRLWVGGGGAPPALGPRGGSHCCPHHQPDAPSLPTEIRTQLVEQFKCLEQQSESRLQLLQDLQEFFRRKAEIELEYSRSLEKLAERFSSKIRSSREHQFK